MKYFYKFMLKKSLLLLALAFIVLNAEGQTPKHEVRAVWLTTLNGLDWPTTKGTSYEAIERQKSQFKAILDQLDRSNVNTILLQTRVRATTIYPSKYEPFDGCLTGKPGQRPGYDPLQFAIEECHKRGMELHAWVVAIPIGKWNSIGCKSLRDKHPSIVMKKGDEGYMNPENSLTSDYIASICKEITERYDIDGIHLDYIRYPENWKYKASKSEGRNHITRIVRKINKAVKDIKPWVKISCSPIGKFSDLSRYPSRGWNAYDAVCQDAQGWLKEGLMDQLYPMMYFRGDNFYPFAIDWAENTHGRTVAPGLGIWLLSRGEGNNWPLVDITREMHVLRQLGMGHTYFRSRFFTDNVKGIFSFAEKDFDQYPSLTPPMTWQSQAIPMAPQSMSMSNEGSVLRLKWWGAQDKSGGPYLMYNVYTSTVSPVDVNDSRNLIARRITHPFLSINADDGCHYYAITAIDRYGNESLPLQSDQPVKKTIEWLANDGRYLTLPPKDPAFDDYYIKITNLAGGTMTIRPYTDTKITIRTLPNGVYALHAMDKHKRSRRIGQFIVKRE